MGMIQINSLGCRLPRFSAKLALKPLQNPVSNKAISGQYLVESDEPEYARTGVEMVIRGNAITQRQDAATRISLPEQTVTDKGQIVELEVPDPADEEKTIKATYFLSGEDLVRYVRREQAKLLHQLSTFSDKARNFQESGNWPEAKKAFAEVLKLVGANTAPADKAYWRHGIFIPPASAANLHFQLAKIMWVEHPVHWLTPTSNDSALKADPINPKYQAFKQLFQLPIRDEDHLKAREDSDMSQAVAFFAQNQPEKALASVRKALEKQPDDPVKSAFKSFLEKFELTPDF